MSLKLIKENASLILTCIGGLGIIYQGLILSKLSGLAFFSRTQIFIDTFYMVLILGIRLILCWHWIYPYINNHMYNWRDLLFSVVVWIIYFLFIHYVIKSQRLLITLMNTIVWGIYGYIFGMTLTKKKNHFRFFFPVISSIVISIFIFGFTIFSGIYLQKTNEKVIYFNDRFIILEDKVIPNNNDNNFYFSGAYVDNFNKYFNK